MENPTDPVPRKSYPYYDWMDNNEVRLKKEIKNILEKLRNNFNYLKV